MTSRLKISNFLLRAALSMGQVWVAALLAIVLTPARAPAQLFMLDDTSADPLVTPLICPVGFPLPCPPLVAFGLGAEDPLGFLGPQPARGPSPTLGRIKGLLAGDGDVLAPPAPPATGPIVQNAPPRLAAFTPALSFIASLSTNTYDFGLDLRIAFSVDRETRARDWPASAVSVEAAAHQAAGDIFTSNLVFTAPQTYIGTLSGSGYVGDLGAGRPGPRGINRLFKDESLLGLRAGSDALIGPGTPAPPHSPGSHDNVDALEANEFASPLTPGVSPWVRSGYFTLYPYMAMRFGLPWSNIYAIRAGGVFACLPAFAVHTQMGLSDLDIIDGLVVYDETPPGLPESVGCSAVSAEPGVDAVLFSLAPGSASLNHPQMKPGDVFFSDFSGAFATYASVDELGLDEGSIAGGDNMDALEVLCAADIDGDGFVGFDDYFRVYSTLADITGDGLHNFQDITLVLDSWALGCAD
jgi:hypothetical protein